MTINRDILNSFSPYPKHHKEFLEHYVSFDGSFLEFLDLKKITHEYKIWITAKVLSKNQFISFGLSSIENLSNISNKKINQIKKYIQIIKNIPNFDSLNSMEESYINTCSKCLYDLALNEKDLTINALYFSVYSIMMALVTNSYASAISWAIKISHYSITDESLKIQQEEFQIKMLRKVYDS